MITSDGKWIMEGLDREDPNCIKDYKVLVDRINEIGFLPLFKNSIEGFSVEEMTIANAWWTDCAKEDPWQWREIIAREGEIAYGKFFNNKAGFISREWFPYFSSYRRDGYDFDSRYEEGLASIRTKKIIDVLSLCDQLPSNELKSRAGFGKNGEKGFEGAMSLLQMQTYITVRSFQRRRNKNNEEFGWPVAIYSLSEKLFGDEYVRFAYKIGSSECKKKMIAQLRDQYPRALDKEIEKLIR